MQLTKGIYKPWVLALLLILPSFSFGLAADDKDAQLRRSMAEIALLNGQLAQRKADAVGIRESLSKHLADLKQEALKVLRNNALNTRAAALAHPRIYYNLLLIGEIEAYIDRYTRTITYYRVACDRLGYLYQQADDDLKIVDTLSDLKIDALVGQTEKILDGYLPDAQTLTIDPATVARRTPAQVLAGLKWVTP